MSDLKLYKKPVGLAKYTSRKQFLEMSPMSANRELRHIKTESDIILSAMNKETPSLAGLRKESSEDEVLAFIGKWLMDLNVSLNIKNKMASFQIEECAFYIIDDYYYLTLSDFKLFFSRIKKGKYGALYESLSTVKILEWLESYVIARTSCFEAQIPVERKKKRVRVEENITGSVKELMSQLDIRKKLEENK